MTDSLVTRVEGMLHLSSHDFWQRHLWQVNPERPYMNSFTRWRVSALYPVRPFVPRRDTQVKPDRMRKKVKAHG